MIRKTIFAAIAIAMALSLCGCGPKDSNGQQSSDSKPADGSSAAPAVTTPDSNITTPEVAEPEEPKPQALTVGSNIKTDHFSITLTSARVDKELASNESRTAWEPQAGGVFVILEFDVTALTSDNLPVDDYAITNLMALYNADTYRSWKLQYIASEIWCTFRHTYLEANLPCHVYAYAIIPAAAFDSGNLSVNLNIDGAPYTVTIR